LRDAFAFAFPAPAGGFALAFGRALA